MANGMPDAPRLVARRYRLLRLLGEGGQGVVWEAHDELTGRVVAVKLIEPERRNAHAIRESAWLRELVLPGVVRLLDEGLDGPQHYLVTERIDGRPFPGAPTPCTWAALQGPTRELLLALAGVHAAGIVHGDLKPANVLVDADGGVRLLDFGLSNRAGCRGDALGVRGTMEYVPPEALLGASPTPAADLFALGVMLYQALTGRGPWQATNLGSLIRARWSPAPPVADPQGSVPPAVVEAVASLLCADPSGRPPDAWQALRQLGLSSKREVLPLPWTAEGPPLRHEELAGAFHGPDRVLHLPTDAASCLLEVTQGDRANVREELEAWRAAGLVRPDAGRLRVERRDLDLLRRRGPRPLAAWVSKGWASPTSLDWLINDGPEGGIDVIPARQHAARQRLEGDQGGALATLELALHVLRASGQNEEDLALVASDYAEAALATERSPVLAHAIWELERVSAFPGRPELVQLLACSRAALEGLPELAREQLEAIASLPCPVLETWRDAVRIQAARRQSTAEEQRAVELAASRIGQAGSPEDEARLAGWRGHLLYRQGRFAEAAEMHEASSRGRTDLHSKIAASINQASASLEAGHTERAEEVAASCLQLAQDARHCLLEARARWLLRTALVRARRPAQADEELVDAVFTLGDPAQGGLVALNEAVLARRGGERDQALRLGRRARTGFHAAGLFGPALLAAALEAEAGGAEGLAWAGTYLKEVDERGSDELLLQSCALLHQATGLVEWARRGLRIEASLPGAEGDRELDVLSLAECRALLRARPARGEGEG